MANERARKLRANMTDAEKTLWLRLRTLREFGHHFRRQVPMGRYIVDFCCHKSKLIIEVDGGQHGFDSEVKADEARTAWLGSEGYCVIRFWNNDVTENLDGVLETIVLELSRHPTPTPPHQGEGLTECHSISILTDNNR